MISIDGKGSWPQGPICLALTLMSLSTFNAVSSLPWQACRAPTAATMKIAATSSSGYAQPEPKPAPTLGISAILLASGALVPVPTPEFMAWRQNTLHAYLPALGGAGASATAAMAARIAGLMGDLLTEPRESRRGTRDARALASAPKSVTEYFKT